MKRVRLAAVGVGVVVVMGLAVGLGVLAGCSAHQGSCHAAAPSQPVAGTPATQIGKPVNTHCPIMGAKINPDKVTPELTRQFKGQTVAFCCGGCPDQWDKLNDAQKQAKLEKSMPSAGH